MKNCTLILLVGVLFLSCGEKEKTETQDKPIKTEYATSMVFRETPFADIRPAKKITKEESKNINHFQLDYDDQGRLVELKYLLNGRLKAYYDRFVRAPHIKIAYTDSSEIRTFYNEYGTRCLVSGSVYQTKIKLDENGKREHLMFYGLEGQPIENDFGIASYKWQKTAENTILEHRYDRDGNIKRNRPGFGYMVTEFQYGSNGLLSKMVNLGESGNQPTPDEAGVVSTKIGYDEHGRFTQWLNLDGQDQPIKGMSAIAEIRYIPSEYSGEEDAVFIDENGDPQNTRWGAHRVMYEFDVFGNELTRRFRDTLNQPLNVSGNLGLAKSTWTEDGMYRKERIYFNIANEAAGIGQNGIHKIKTFFDAKGNPVCTSSYDLEDNLVMDPSRGYAKDSLTFDNQNRLIARQFFDTTNSLADHNTWAVASFKYSYNEKGELLAVETKNAAGDITPPQWNPVH